MYCDLFFFKQKTAYEMRISDWSSDVCSSDLRGFAEFLVGAAVARAEETADSLARFEEIGGVGGDEADRARKPVAAIERRRRAAQDPDRLRSEEHTSELQSLMRLSYAVLCLKKKNNYTS